VGLQLIIKKGAKIRYDRPFMAQFKEGEKLEIQARVRYPLPNLKDDDKVPVTLITGFLGSGKTTLLNRILREQHGKKLAVIENEVGAVSIDDALVSDKFEEEEDIMTLDNGCLCCKVRGDLVKVFDKLVHRHQELDGILIETTGLANPAPVIHTIQLNKRYQKVLRLDGVLTIVDAKHINNHLANKTVSSLHRKEYIHKARHDWIVGSKLQYRQQEGDEWEDGDVLAVSQDG